MLFFGDSAVMSQKEVEDTKPREPPWLVCERCGAPFAGPRGQEAPKAFALICAQCGGRIFVKLFQAPLHLSTD